MNRSMALGLAMVAGSAFVATAVTGLHAQNKPSDERTLTSTSAPSTAPPFSKRFLPRRATSTAIPPDWADHSLTARFPLDDDVLSDL